MKNPFKKVYNYFFPRKLLVEYFIEASKPALPDISAIEQETNRDQAVTLSALSLRVVGGFGFPLLSLLSWPFQAWLAGIFIRYAWRDWQTEGKMTAHAFDAVLLTFMPLFGYATVINVFYAALAFSQKILLKTRRQSRQDLVNIFGETPRHVWVKRDEVELQIPFEEVHQGDIVVVHAGETIPVDGIIVTGMASIDQQRLTGEAQPAELEVGDTVLAATIVLSGSISIGVTQAGTETIAAQIGAILNQTADYRSPLESQGEQLANAATPPMFALSALSLPFIGPVPSLAMLSAAPGYHLRITAPISLLNFLKIATANGILVKDGRALELLPQIDTVVFDKTGTLTKKIPHVAAIHCCDGYRESNVLRYAAIAEYRQTHPIALAILQAANARQLTLSRIEDSAYKIGYGVQVMLNNQWVRVGSRRFMDMQAITIPPQIQAIQADSHERGSSLVYVALDDQLCGAIELQPSIRPEAEQIIRDLQQRHIEVIIISGDHEPPTQRLAQTLGVDDYFAEVLPEQKAELVAKLQQAGRCVCFVGDGINDAIALKQADLSISLSGASSIATDTAEVVLMDGQLTQLIPFFDLGKELEDNMRINRIESVTPATLCVIGVYLLGFTITTTTVVNYICFNVGILNAMLPVLRRRLKLTGERKGDD